MNDIAHEILLESSMVASLEQWLESQRCFFRLHARSLTPRERDPLGSYFSAFVLDSVRVHFLESFDELERPPLYRQVESSKGTLPIDFSRITGLTLRDTILLSQQHLPVRSDFSGVLFQECVHVCQFNVLGVNKFLEEYIRGWLDSGKTHELIPLESAAYNLRLLFESGVGTPVLVDDLVAESLSACRR